MNRILQGSEMEETEVEENAALFGDYCSIAMRVLKRRYISTGRLNQIQLNTSEGMERAWVKGTKRGGGSSSNQPA